MIETIAIDSRIRYRDPSELVCTPRIVRVRSFDEEGVKSFSDEISSCHQTGQALIPIVIDSFGGDAYALFAMVDILRTVKIPIATIAEGKVMSCGAALFTCGAEGRRYMGHNATVMMHEITSDGDKDTKATDIKIEAKETNRLNRKLWKLMERDTGCPMGSLWAEFNRRHRSDWSIPPKDALRLNITNHIGIPTLKTTVSVQTVLSL